jgi:hypothetical protein
VSDPKEPDFTPLAQGAITMNELYRAYQAAGFTRAESLQIVIAMVREVVRMGAGK